MIKYRILPEHQLMVFCFWGETDEQEILEFSSELRADPEFSNNYDALADTSRLLHSISGDEIRDLAEPRVEMSANRRLAVVAPADFAYGPARMHQALSERRNQIHIQIFRDRESALAWLDKQGVDLDRICEETVAEDGRA